MYVSVFHLQQACQRLQRSGVIAYPTEAVFGLGCDPDDHNALQKLLAIKQRPVHKGVILIASALQQLTPYLAPLSSEHMAMLQHHWPGPVTFVCPASERVSELLSGGRGTIAVRVSAHPLVQALCQRWGKPLVSTSANLTGQAPARTAFTVQRYFAQQLDYVMPGQVGKRRNPSEIRDLLTGTILRQG